MKRIYFINFFVGLRVIWGFYMQVGNSGNEFGSVPREINQANNAECSSSLLVQLNNTLLSNFPSLDLTPPPVGGSSQLTLLPRRRQTGTRKADGGDNSSPTLSWLGRGGWDQGGEAEACSRPSSCAGARAPQCSGQRGNTLSKAF